MSPESILEGLIQGTARRTLAPEGILGEGLVASDPSTAPRLLALAVQAQLHALPALPASFDEIAIEHDRRPLIAKDLRTPVLRLVSGKGNPPDDAAALALALALSARGLRLHPFDLPRLTTFVKRHAEMLGVATSEDESAPGPGNWFTNEVLDQSNWMLAPPARKAAFIAELRANDSAGARELVEAQLPLEKAEVRLRLIDALATGLSSDDQAFLETLTGGRAPTVKQAVTRLLARLPGTGAAAAQIEELVSRVQQGKTGLLRKRTTLKLQLPANLKGPGPINEWLAANFGAVGADALAAAFGMNAPAMLEAAQGDDSLVQGIAYAACAGRDWPLLRDIAAQHAPTIWTDFLQPGLAACGVASAAERNNWLASVMSGPVSPATVNAWTLSALHQVFAGPLPVAQARALFSAALKVTHPSAELYTAVTALMPGEALGEARAALGQIPSDFSARAIQLADILFSLNQGTAQP